MKYHLVLNRGAPILEFSNPDLLDLDKSLIAPFREQLE